jgi:signal transduction histidine kinase
MQPTGDDRAPRKERFLFKKGKSRSNNEKSSWFRSPAMGYLASVLLVCALLLIEKIDEHIPQVSLFIGAPFCLLSILVALVWGTGPALVALVFGLIVVFDFISPGLVNTDLLRDIAILGPFILLQIVAIATVVWLERSRRELQQSNQQLEQATALKDYVLMRAAHELKTPLTTILGRTQLLSSRIDKSGETPENWAAFQKYLSVVEARALHLRELIDSLFDLSRVRAEENPLQQPPCDLERLCRDVIEDQQTLSGRMIELTFPPHPLLISADEKRLMQVLANLLNNAVKYSPEDTVIKVQAQTDANSIIVQVYNECPALSKEQVEHLFDPFYRTPAVEYSSIPGWGLGLTVSKEIVERHRGQIWVESSRENGITFFVKLPRQSHAGGRRAGVL